MDDAGEWQLIGSVQARFVADHDEIVVKVDESNNTRIHFAKSSVQSVLKSAANARTEEQLAEAE